MTEAERLKASILGLASEVQNFYDDFNDVAATMETEPDEVIALFETDRLVKFFSGRAALEDRLDELRSREDELNGEEPAPSTGYEDIIEQTIQGLEERYPELQRAGKKELLLKSKIIIGELRALCQKREAPYEQHLLQ